jgi:alpha-glucuronidase
MGRDACWLPAGEVPHTLRSPAELAAWELQLQNVACSLEIIPELGDAYEIFVSGDVCRIRGGDAGVLYGAYRLLLSHRTALPLPVGLRVPAYPYRMLDHWDNMDGSVERGYAGASLFFTNGDFREDWPLLRAYARLLASVSINVVCLNNVNVAGSARELITERFLPKVAQVAELFATFGIRLMLSVDFAMPLWDGLPTADPLDERVQAWWARRAALVYRYVPTLFGFLVKADSENRPGPYAYGCDHAQGANLLARALRPHGGTLVWRCFVYNCQQDWRDRKTDRPMAAYENYAGLDGQFDDNVILQIKHGPFDFQVREPVSPLLLTMPQTAKAVEWQLTQEYTGQQKDLYAMQGMWGEVLADLPQGSISAMAAVANTGVDPFWTGHPFAQLNLFAYGLIAWQPSAPFELTTQLWARLTYALRGAPLRTLTDILLLSREIYEKYTAPLGLCWMVNPGHHYGPSPMGYEYTPWGTYHRADREAVGVDRSLTGTGYLRQYPPALQARYGDAQLCPDKLVLFFHRLPYTHRLRDGRTLIQRIYDDHFEGANEAERLQNQLHTLRAALPEEVVAAAEERMRRQLENAREWRDVLCDFFHRLSGIADEKGRL